AATSLTVDFGGGLKSDQDIAIAFDCGAAMVTGGSIAVNQPNTFERWINHFGADRIILGADARNGKISVSGWQQTTDTDLITFIKQWHTKGINKVICTDISRDGMLIGAANELYRQILTAIPDIYLIASGGVGSMRDIEDLSYIVPAVIFGKAFYENKITKRDIINYLRP
ncbi:MAG: 1-(5-phosphoribosyl)-5-[(5-phosphoribosylamino)methylideneamino]imidazole-4-carboxamide isomerase, partial [Tannerella sp.]|nr:1-(5-phosphoribosyl)-5-[(5-phosphoribosylamino)methylideneamino]imidazole-4-carboxamide isomerase [Tannerella sp.]